MSFFPERVNLILEIKYIMMGKNIIQAQIRNIYQINLQV